MRTVFTVIEGILLMTALIAIAGLDSEQGGDICGIVTLVSMIGLAVTCKLEEGYEFGE